ncbi:MAG: MoxR family ATPase [Elusimicrobia bacterium]|nr:MoxR family ATPase [Elusimicrobiota bacterium]
MNGKMILALILAPQLALAQTVKAPVTVAPAAPLAGAAAASLPATPGGLLSLPQSTLRLAGINLGTVPRLTPRGRLLNFAQGIARALAPQLPAQALPAAEPETEHPLAAEVKERSGFVETYRGEFKKAIVGQDEMRDSILIGLLAGGHILLEGVPGLAKTRAVRAVTSMLELQGDRIQFTRDLLPGDITGQEVLNLKTNELELRKGKIFTNVLLADEINRAKGTTQGGLLEAMEEHQVTINGVTYALPDVFLVLATQNPIEEDGVHPLPKAQLDRFMFKVHVTYPSESELSDIVSLNLGHNTAGPVQKVLSKEELMKARETVGKILVSDDIKAYISRLVVATNPDKSSIVEVKKSVRTGVSPRAAIWLARSAQAYAFLQGRHYVKPEDVRAVAHRVLRHRIILQFEAEGRVTADQVVAQVLLDTPAVSAK